MARAKCLICRGKGYYKTALRVLYDRVGYPIAFDSLPDPCHHCHGTGMEPAPRVLKKSEEDA